MPLIIADNNWIQNRIMDSVAIAGRHTAIANFKARLKAIDSECGTCIGKQSEAVKRQKIVWNEIRQYLANLSPSGHQEIRAALNLRPTDRVRVSYHTGSGKSAALVAKEF